MYLQLSLYADDTDIFLDAIAISMDEVLEEMKLFGLVSGCKCNLENKACVPPAKYDLNLLLLELNNSSSLQQISDKNFLISLNVLSPEPVFWSRKI